MCVVSMITDHYYDKWRSYPYKQGEIIPTIPNDPLTAPTPSPITQEEINEFRELLERARQYDIENNEPDCELKEKRDRLLKLAEELGVNIDFV